MYEWSLVAECDAVLEIRDDNRVSGKKKNNNNNQTATVTSDCKRTDLDRDQTESWTGHRMDRHTGLCQACHLSYHMINSDRKSQSHNSKYTILSHNVLMVVKTLRSKQMKLKDWRDL